jgi:hypothetical protein
MLRLFFPLDVDSPGSRTDFGDRDRVHRLVWFWQDWSIRLYVFSAREPRFMSFDSTRTVRRWGVYPRCRQKPWAEAKGKTLMALSSTL